MAIVHTFATINQDQQNNIVIAQEVLHSVDASDKHGKNGEPLFPQGYAAPNQTPIYPQTKAEIMSARIPLSINTSKMAPDLTQCILGAETAKEINWTQSPY